MSVGRGWGLGGWASKKSVTKTVGVLKLPVSDTPKVHADRQLTAVVLPVSPTCENTDTLVVR